MSSGSSSPPPPKPPAYWEKGRPQRVGIVRRDLREQRDDRFGLLDTSLGWRPPPPHRHPPRRPPSPLDKELNVFQPVRKERKGAQA